MSFPGSYPTPASEEIQEIFLIPNMQRIFPLPTAVVIVYFYFLQNGRKE